MTRVNAFLVCCACKDVLECIFGAPSGGFPVVDGTAIRDHARQHPACVGSHAHLTTRAIEPEQYRMVARRGVR